MKPSLLPLLLHIVLAFVAGQDGDAKVHEWQAQDAGAEMVARERFTGDLGTAEDSKAKLAQALKEFKDITPKQSAKRAKGAAQQAADLEHEISRKAAGLADIGLAKVIEAVNKQSADKRQHMFSVLS